MRKILTAVTLVAALAAAAPLAAEDAPDLATRCEQVVLTGPAGDSADLLPAGLVEIGNELRARGTEALDDIEAGLSKSANLRRLAPSVVNDWPCDRTRALLVALLDDRDDLTACSAAFALHEVGGAEVIEPLLAAARKRPGMVRHNVVNALDDLGALHRGLELALGSTADREPWVRHSAYACLADVDWRNGVAEAIPVLEEALANEANPGAAAAAERALAVLRARE